MYTADEQAMIVDMEALIAEMKQHPEIRKDQVPENLHKELWRDIREYEA